MRFLVDESTDTRIAPFLTALGHDVILVATAYGRGVSDERVLMYAVARRRILITEDRDFGELVFRLHRPHAGVIYLRLSTTVLAVRIARLNDVLQNYADFLDQFLVVTSRRVRIRQAE